MTGVRVGLAIFGVIVGALMYMYGILWLAQLAANNHVDRSLQFLIVAAGMALPVAIWIGNATAKK